ncbi:MAG: NADH-quinone oxidoreductase subunit K [Coprothermobacterota bacterium]|nr:NADH-quinone oxidoreductase subunit K [Coprothermobacterota bacterium]
MSENLLPYVFVLFGLGLFCLLTQRNLIKLLVGLELLGKATTLAIVWSGVLRNTPDYAQSLALMVIAIEVMVVAIFLALINAFHQKSQNLDTDDLRRLKG